MQSKPSRKSRSCLPIPNHKHFFSIGRHQSLCCNGDSQTPVPDKAISPLTSKSHILSWHLKLCVAEHLINCPTASPCLPFLPAPLFSFAYPTYLQYKPREMQKAPALGKKASTTAPSAPHFTVRNAYLAQMSHPSVVPKPAPQDIPHCLYFTCTHIQAGAGRNQ